MTICLVNPGGIRLAWSVDVQGSATEASCRTHHVVISTWIYYCTSNMILDYTFHDTVCLKLRNLIYTSDS